jgi:hypothetical protein
MATTHVQPDHAAEINAIHADLLSPAILAASWAVPAPPSMTFAPFEVYGYVLAGSPARLTYVYQAPVSLALTGGDGAYWVAIHADTSTVVAGWTRRIGSHYLWRAAGTRPADPPGGLVALGVTVAGGVITATDYTLAFPHQKLAVGGGRGQLTYAPYLTWTGSTLTVTGAASVTGTLTVSGNATVGGTFYAGGLGSFGAGVNVTGNLYTTGQVRAVTTLYSDGPATLASTLQVNGGSQLAASVTVGMIGTAATAVLDVNGTVRSRGALTCDGVVNIGVAAGHALNVAGNAYVSNTMGIGRGPEGGWSLTTNGGLLSYGAIQGNAGLAIATTGTFLGNVAVASTNTTTYQLLVAGTAGKIGGGLWSDVSSRHLKRAITDIPDALGLLLAQRGRCYEWEEPEHAAALPGPQYGFVADEVTLPQWREPGTDILTVRGFEALAVEAFRTIVARLEALEALA